MNITFVYTHECGTIPIGVLLRSLYVTVVSFKRSGSCRCNPVHITVHISPSILLST